jgi:hypothetical protein
MKTIFYFLFSTIVLFISCVTPYQTTGYTGGYSETQLAENVFSVVFSGNGYTSFERTTNYCLLRCAELAKMNGFDYFVIVENKERVSQSTYTTPSNYNTTGRVNSVGNTTYGNFNTTSSGGQTYNITKPSVNNTIKCFKEKPDNYEIVYESDFVIKSIKSKYQINVPKTPSIDTVELKEKTYPETQEELALKNLIKSKKYYEKEYSDKDSVKVNDIVKYTTFNKGNLFAIVIDNSKSKIILKYFNPKHIQVEDKVTWWVLKKIVPTNSN